MRLKPDGSLDLDWREQPSRKWELTKEQRDEELLNSILRNPDPYPHFTWSVKMLIRNIDF
jgi:hypothetical protein